MSEQERISIRTMNSDDIDFAMSVKNAEGWNQLPADWERYMSWEPDGCFVALWDGQRAGTATTIAYGKRFGWIGMVLVRPELRRRGIGTALLKRCIDYLQQAGVATVKLDATPKGQPLYEKLGFEDEYRVQRHEGNAARIVDGGAGDSMTDEHINGIVDLDMEAFGGDRSRVLRSLLNEPEVDSIAAGDNGDISGYAFVRPGTNAPQIGPFVATDAQAAGELLTAALGRHDGAIYIDIPLPNDDAGRLLKQYGFDKQRDFTRMYLGSNEYAGRPELIYSLAGPEMG